MPDLALALAAAKAAGRGAFVPYVTGGLEGVDADLLRGLEEAGADAVEVGIPFSDPVMDGPVIQEASRRALLDGATPSSVLATIKEAGLGIPVAVMTYANPVWHAGHASFLAECVDAGVSGVIVPDLPVDEADDWIAACAGASVSPVFLAAPGTPRARLGTVARASRGFLYCVATYGVTGARERLAVPYCVATYGVTGARERLAETARDLVARLRAETDLPLLVGVGISEPSQAADARAFADGAIVGSALVHPLLEGDGSETRRRAAAFAGTIHGA